MFVLTKRSRPDENGTIFHVIHGTTPYADAARCWIRSTRTTDVIEVPDFLHSELQPEWNQGSNISDTRFKSWREQQLEHDKAARNIGGCVK